MSSSMLSALRRSKAFNKVRFSSLKEQRNQRKAKHEEYMSKHAEGFKPSTFIGLGFIAFVAFAAYDAKKHPTGRIATQVNSIKKSLFGQFDEMFLPASDKLIPDWVSGDFYGPIPPGHPPRPLLVLDLERTLIGSTHDMQKGWRHVKRPGLDQFIQQLSQYYEIVIHSENDINVVAEVVEAIDPQHLCHRLGNIAGEMRGVQVLKRLDCMNRELNQIILIDDSEEASQLFPRNTLLIKPFVDIHDKSDTILLELIPLLQSFVHSDVKDFRAAFDQLGTHEAEEATVEYRMRLSQKKFEREQMKNSGLGGLIRQKVNKKEREEDDGFIRSRILSARDIVGAAPEGDYGDFPRVSGDKKTTSSTEIKLPDGTVMEKKDVSTVKKGSATEYFLQKEAEKAALKAKKQQEMNELYQKKLEKQAAAEQAKKQEQFNQE